MHNTQLLTEKDYDSFRELLRDAFDVTNRKDLPEWVKACPEGPTFVIKEGDRVVSTLTIMDFEFHFRGGQIPFGGIQAVATAPTHRRKGMVRSLFNAAFQKMHDDGVVVSMLDPFLEVYYEQFGYASVESFVKYSFNTKILRSLRMQQGVTARLALDSASDLDAISELMRSMCRFGSRCLIRQRSIKEAIKRNAVYLIEQNNKPVGFVNLGFEKEADGAPTLIVNVACYSTDDVFPSMFAFVKAFGDQMVRIKWLADSSLPVYPFICERNDLKAEQKGSMMLRVVNFKDLCKRIKIPENATESVVIEIKDKDIPSNAGTFLLSPMNGRLSIETVDSAPDLTVDALGLSRIVGGFVPAIELEKCGFVSCSRDAARRLQQIFPPENVRVYERF